MLENNDLESFKPTNTSRVDDTAATLAAELEQMKKERKVERFFWVFSFSVLFLSFISAVLPWAATIEISVLVIIFLISAAIWLDVKWVIPYLERCLQHRQPRMPPEIEPPESSK